jgi:hypothetical protein
MTESTHSSPASFVAQSLHGIDHMPSVADSVFNCGPGNR